jgi:S1-C subfamily serine protease
VQVASLHSTTALLCWAVGCGSPPSEVLVLTDGLVYGSDDRVELFEAEALVRELGASVVALGLRSEISEEAPWVLSVLSRSWKERAGLCEDERFAEQPSFALCTGVAIDTDLVLTASHCARAAPLDELAIVTGYSYLAPGELRLAGDGRVHAIESVLASDSYWDYAWLRVEAGLVALPPERRRSTEISAGDALFSINHGGGLPAKVDAGGRGYPLNADELLTTLDAFGGASGGPVFSSDGNLVGILTAGNQDYATTSAGCAVVASVPDLPDAANELVVGLRVPMDAIADVTPDDPAFTPNDSEPMASRKRPDDGGCTVRVSPSPQPAWPWYLIVMWLACARRCNPR